MVDSAAPDRSTPADFRLAGWIVQPNLNRLSTGHRTVQLEPKMMDVLVYLADNCGQVVTKIDITDAVWPDQFVTESVITRSIAGLRRAFGDDARNPRFIETISKRGYRLIAEVVEMPGSGAAPRTSEPVAEVAAPGIAPAVVPYVVGQWVRGEYFYGRHAVIDEVLRGNRNWIWLLGTRRIGKTSVLKQLEHLAAANPELGFVPVFWDLQGADQPDDLHLDFADALLDAEDHLEAAGIRLQEVRAEDCFQSLGHLRRALQLQGRRLLLLCDEVEELLQLHRKDPSLLRKLRRALHSKDGIRSVLASSSKLWQLADTDEDTSPFLDGFTPPLTIGPLSDESARRLIRQDKLPAGSGPSLGEDEVEHIRELCGNHPYQIQLLCRKLLDCNDLDTAVEKVIHDRAVAYFFSVDFELISETDRAVLRHLAEVPGATSDSASRSLDAPADLVGKSLSNLVELGLVVRATEDRHSVSSFFLRRWLNEGMV